MNCTDPFILRHVTHAAGRQRAVHGQGQMKCQVRRLYLTVISGWDSRRCGVRPERLICTAAGRAPGNTRALRYSSEGQLTPVNWIVLQGHRSVK